MSSSLQLSGNNVQSKTGGVQLESLDFSNLKMFSFNTMEWNHHHHHQQHQSNNDIIPMPEYASPDKLQTEGGSMSSIDNPPSLDGLQDNTHHHSTTNITANITTNNNNNMNNSNVNNDIIEENFDYYYSLLDSVCNNNNNNDNNENIDNNNTHHNDTHNSQPMKDQGSLQQYIYDAYRDAMQQRKFEIQLIKRMDSMERQIKHLHFENTHLVQQVVELKAQCECFKNYFYRLHHFLRTTIVQEHMDAMKQ